MKIFKTLELAKASVDCNSICTICGNTADAPFVNIQSGHACVAIIHDNHAHVGLRTELVRKWQQTKHPRPTGIAWSGMVSGR